jgi:GR25 family glycosyltransferase involved in LPS biosynthesis
MNMPRTFVLTVNRPIKRFDETTKHLDEIGIKWEPFIGMDNQKCRLNSKDTFDFDRAGERLEAKHVAATLTHYLLWKVMQYQPDDSFVALEFDVRFTEHWQPMFDLAMKHLPEDWDLVYLGSCCCNGRPTIRVQKETGFEEATSLYEVKYPLCGHAIMYRKKSLETLLDVHQKINMPLDIAMYHMSLPKLKVYTILPRIVDQHATFLPP